MAYSLKTSGLATKLAACIMVDDDGVTLREWVSGWSSVWDGASAWTDNNASDMTVDNPVTVGSAIWKGTTRYYFETFADGNYNFSGVRFPNDILFSGTTPAPGIFVASAGLSGSHYGYIVNQDGNVAGGLRTTTAAALEWATSGVAGPGTLDGAIDDSGVPISLGGNYQDTSGTLNSTLVYGLESGTLSTLVNAASSAGTINGVRNIGGRDGQSSRRPGKYHVVALFDEHLTTTEYQALHEDWFGELFSVAVDTTSPTLSSAAVDGTSLTLTYDETLDMASVPATGDFTVTGSVSGAIAVSSVNVSDTDVNLTLASAVDDSETVSLDYTPGTSPIQDTSGNAAASLTGQTVTNNTATNDTTAPVFTVAPAAANITNTTLDVTLTLDEAGTIYSVVLADAATAPTSAEVKAGTGAGGAAPVDAGSTLASASTQATISHTGLTAGTAYDVYVVAEDDEATPNLQASPTLVNATTATATVTKTVTVQIAGAASLTGLRWAFFDSPNVDQWSAPTAKGGAASTDANGNLTVNVDGSALADGAWGYLYVTDNDGTLSASNHHGAPAQVSVS